MSPKLAVPERERASAKRAERAPYLEGTEEASPSRGSTSPEKEGVQGEGTPRYSRLLKTYTQGYLSICIYLNVVQGCDYYDIVIHRRIRDRQTGQQVWRRGANLKPTDLTDACELLQEAREYLRLRGISLQRDLPR